MTDNDALVRELLPCPFCGADAEIEQDSDHHGEWFNLGCSRHWGHVRNPDHQNTCIAGRIFYTETDVTEAEAIASWNTRSTPQPKPLDPPAQDEVEAVARAINPHAWGLYDRSLVPFAEKRGARSSTDDCVTYELMWKDGCRTVEDAKSWWLTNERPVMVRAHHFRESLRQATAAIAALDRHPAADDALREENARLREALKDASVSLSWAARQMKGNCSGSAVDAVNLAAGNASSAAALTGGQG